MFKDIQVQYRNREQDRDQDQESKEDRFVAKLLHILRRHVCFRCKNMVFLWYGIEKRNEIVVMVDNVINRSKRFLICPRGRSRGCTLRNETESRLGAELETNVEPGLK
ncbi:hypothetical protein EVAR_55348_1 [Eumeta japonica]|uniref:Uncharacterized protein n=1 Tax=Eumeta variegata TaxID=151549 RepID=A0A4C1YIF9_EUMVA|nr:hypothetical protein EVAR_55348_1 [Eumeta japonica]